jgi:hypothetical protein
MMVCFLIGSLDIPGFVVPHLISARNRFGVLSSTASSVAWALSTTFKPDELSADSNIMAAPFAAMSTGVFVPFSQIV